MTKYIIIEKIKSDKNFSVKFIGDLSVLSDEVREKCLEAENMAKDKEFVCNIALNYGGRDEIVHAAFCGADGRCGLRAAAAAGITCGKEPPGDEQRREACKKLTVFFENGLHRRNRPTE